MIMEVFTALLVIITGFYAWVTFKILKVNQGVLREMRDQQDSLYRPYISISPVAYSDSSIFYLKIKNTGQTAAHKLRLNLDRDFYQFGEKKDERNLRNVSAFSSVVDSFVPGAEMLFYLAQGFVIFGKEGNETVTPPVFTATADYELM